MAKCEVKVLHEEKVNLPSPNNIFRTALNPTMDRRLRVASLVLTLYLHKQPTVGMNPGSRPGY